MTDLFKEHINALDDINFELDFRDLYNFHQNIWVTRNHLEYIPLSEMSTEHLINSIALIERESIKVCFGLGQVWLPKLKEELKRRENE